MKIIPKKLKEVLRIIFAGIAIFSALSIITYNYHDVAWFITEVNSPIKNITGIFGAYLVFWARFLFGNAVWVIPFMFVLWCFNISKIEYYSEFLKEVLGVFIFSIIAAGVCGLFLTELSNLTMLNKGGIIGHVLSGFLLEYFNFVGSLIILSVLLLLSLCLATEFYFLALFSGIFKGLVSFKNFVLEKIDNIKIGRLEKNKNLIPRKTAKAKRKIVKHSEEEGKKELLPKRVVFKRENKQIPVAKKNKAIPKGESVLPPIDLLEEPPKSSHSDKEDIEARSDLLESTLHSFDIDAHVSQVNQGPVITVFEVQPAPGIKVNKITALANDIALALKAPCVRIIAPIPGKSVVGIEVPNANPENVYIRDLLETDMYDKSESKLTLALGKDVAGNPVFASLDKMPHLLIAGATGAGKSVCLNSLIVSIFYKALPSEVKFIMIDPKMVEMAFFNDVPHLLCPVITDAKKASQALNWAVSEMEQRYELFARVGVRNIAGYNKRMQNISPEMLESIAKDEDEKIPEKMHYIVIVVDELADLMMTASQDVEHAITRLAQLSRAIGIHIILATQRPSVNVITGVIKANLPCRIGFKVSSSIDSRTILDSKGAEELLGRGDMLFLPPGTSNLIRCQSGFLSDDEIRGVVDFLKQTGEPEYDQSILNPSASNGGIVDGDMDEVYDEAVRVVMELGQASASLLQRRMRIGYNRAARLIEAMEEKGIVSAARGSKPREILVDADEYAFD